MARSSPSTAVLRALFARSGNRCAFPGCSAVLVNEKNLFVAEVCHIEAAEPGGERYNPDKSDDQRRDYGNLLILCHPHHVETNDAAEFPVERLREFKVQHEVAFGQKPYKIDESLLYKISFEMDAYWSNIDTLHKTQHIVPELSVPVDVRASYRQLADEVESLLDTLSTWSWIVAESDRRRYDDLAKRLDEIGVGTSALGDDLAQRFSRGNWQLVNLALPNHVTRLRALLVQMELQYLEAYMKLNPTDAHARLRLEDRKIQFERIATTHGLAD